MAEYNAGDMLELEEIPDEEEWVDCLLAEAKKNRRVTIEDIITATVDQTPNYDKQVRLVNSDVGGYTGGPPCSPSTGCTVGLNTDIYGVRKELVGELNSRLTSERRKKVLTVNSTVSVSSPNVADRPRQITDPIVRAPSTLALLLRRKVLVGSALESAQYLPGGLLEYILIREALIGRRTSRAPLRRAAPMPAARPRRSRTSPRWRGTFARQARGA
eukprot:3023900-Pyramimonas_sp.AAC.1